MRKLYLNESGWGTETSVWILKWMKNVLSKRNYNSVDFVYFMQAKVYPSASKVKSNDVSTLISKKLFFEMSNEHDDECDIKFG